MKKNTKKMNKVALTDQSVPESKAKKVKGGPIYMSPAALNLSQVDFVMNNASLNFKK